MSLFVFLTVNLDQDYCLPFDV